MKLLCTLDFQITSEYAFDDSYIPEYEKQNVKRSKATNEGIAYLQIINRNEND